MGLPWWLGGHRELPSPFHHVRTRWEDGCIGTRRWVLASPWIRWWSDLRFPVSRSVRNKFLLFSLWYVVTTAQVDKLKVQSPSQDGLPFGGFSLLFLYPSLGSTVGPWGVSPLSSIQPLLWSLLLDLLMHSSFPVLTSIHTFLSGLPCTTGYRETFRTFPDPQEPREMGTSSRCTPFPWPFPPICKVICFSKDK